MYKFLLFLLGGFFYFYGAFAEEIPTIVYGEAKRSDGGENVFVVEQPKDAPNPLGHPLPNPDNPVEVFGDEYHPINANTTTNNTFNGETNTGSAQNQTQTIQNLGKDFENTLLEANGRVYDVQSYPKADFKAMEDPADPATIYSPNVND